MEDRKGDVRVYLISGFFLACTIGGVSLSAITELTIMEDGVFPLSDYQGLTQLCDYGAHGHGRRVFPLSDYRGLTQLYDYGAHSHGRR
ncbi:unnamed protein product, partial [Sphenostylis stenocarpa]